MVEFPLIDLDLSPCVASGDTAPYPTKINVTASPTEQVTEEETEEVEKTLQENTTTVEETPVVLPTISTPSDETSESVSPKTRVRRGYTDSNLEGSRSIKTEYQLYGVVNHLGALGGGHYTAYCKNAIDGHWYSYDDDRVRLIEETQIVTTNAYLLFYIRSDMENKSIIDLYPTHVNEELNEDDIDRLVEQGDERKCSLM